VRLAVTGPGTNLVYRHRPDGTRTVVGRFLGKPAG
jgi:hypothetical protein